MNRPRSAIRCFDRCRQVGKLLYLQQNVLFLVNSKTEFSSSALEKGKATLVSSLFFVSCEEKYCYRVVSVGQHGLTAARTAGTATVVLNKSFFRSFFLVLSQEV